MILVPLNASPNQRLTVRLGNQDCTIVVAQKGDLMYLSLAVGTRQVITGVAVFNRVLLVRYAYLDFVGDLTMVDMQGNDTPAWDGLGARYQLVYLSPGAVTFRRRRIRVQIQLVGDTFDGGADSRGSANIRCRASIRATQGGATPFQSQAQIRIEGMRPEDMAKLLTLGLSAGLYNKNLITIFAGDDVAGLSQVFSGSIYSGFVDYNAMPDVGVELSCSSTAQLQQAPIAASSYKGPMGVASMLQGIASTAGLTFVNAGVTNVLANHAVGGSAASQIADICQAAGVIYDVQNQTLTVWPATGTRDDQTIAISPENGLIGYPQYSAQGIDVQMEFNPNVLLGRKLSVTSSTPAPTGQLAQLVNPAGIPAIGANGTFYVFDANHEISSETLSGPWFTFASLSSVNTQVRPS